MCSKIPSFQWQHIKKIKVTLAIIFTKFLHDLQSPIFNDVPCVSYTCWMHNINLWWSYALSTCQKFLYKNKGAWWRAAEISESYSHTVESLHRRSNWCEVKVGPVGFWTVDSRLGMEITAAQLPVLKNIPNTITKAVRDVLFQYFLEHLLVLAI